MFPGLMELNNKLSTDSSLNDCEQSVFRSLNLLKQPAKIGPPREFSSVLLTMPDSFLDPFISLQSQIAPDELVAKGLETEPHITIKYGLHTENYMDVLSQVGPFGSIDVEFGSLSVFEQEEHDVLFIAVKSERLIELNQIIGELETTDTHTGYKPHLTVAFVKPGTGKAIAERLTLPSEIAGRRITFDKFVFSGRDRNRTTCGLDGSIRKSGGGCGANGPGGDGFREGNTCGKESSNLHEKVVKDGGFTYQPVKGKSPKTGYAIAAFPESERIIERENFTTEILGDFLEDNWMKFTEDSRIHAGAWYNKKSADNPNGDDKIYLDLSIVVEDRDEAVALAKEHGQLGIFNLESFETI